MTYQRNETPEPLASDLPAVSKKPFHPQADYVLDLLVAAGHITREKAFQARDIAVEFGPDAAPPAPGAPGQEAAAVQAPTVEQAIELLVAALRDSKGWMRDYADAIIRDAIDRRGAAVQAVGAWQDIATAPKDNARLLYLARFDRDGDLVEIDFDGIWESYSEHLDGQLIADGFIWQSANGIEEPTHWAYQDGPPPVTGIVVPRAALMEIAKDLDHICAHGDAGSQETAHDARDTLRAALPPSGAGEKTS